MLKNIFGRRFKRDTNERRALFKGLLSALVLNEKITTTEAKAKAIKAEADKMVTRARKEILLAKKLLSYSLTPAALDRFLKEIAPRFKDINGGYVSITRLGKRLGDNASMVLLKWVKGPRFLPKVISSETEIEAKKEPKISLKAKVVKDTKEKPVKNKVRKNLKNKK